MPRFAAFWDGVVADPASTRYTPTVIHGDLNAEHVLVDDGQVSGVIDFGAAMIADPALDLAGFPNPLARAIIERDGPPFDSGLWHRQRTYIHAGPPRAVTAGTDLGRPDLVRDGLRGIERLFHDITERRGSNRSFRTRTAAARPFLPAPSTTTPPSSQPPSARTSWRSAPSTTRRRRPMPPPSSRPRAIYWNPPISASSTRTSPPTPPGPASRNASASNPSSRPTAIASPPSVAPRPRPRHERRDSPEGRRGERLVPGAAGGGG